MSTHGGIDDRLDRQEDEVTYSTSHRGLGIQIYLQWSCNRHLESQVTIDNRTLSGIYTGDRLEVILFMSERSYELVLLGATGYTGCLAAEYIQTHVDPGLKWAIAGRDGSRLHELAQKLKSIDTNRLQPGMGIGLCQEPGNVC